MTDPITPPPELRAQWRKEAPVYRDCGVGREEWLMDRAAQWGADAELEACCEQLDELQLGTCYPVTGDKLRAARRPKPLSEADQALAALREAEAYPGQLYVNGRSDTIRRALERLKELEASQ
jgi:hypothetical protein